MRSLIAGRSGLRSTLSGVVRNLHRPDLYASAIIILICGLLYLRTYWFAHVPASMAQNVQPTTFPRLVLIAIVLLTLGLPFEHQRKLKRGVDLDSSRRAKPKPVVWYTAMMLLVTTALLQWVGAIVSLFVVCACLPLMWGERRWKILVPYVVVFPAAVVWFFAVVLQVTFPPGLIGSVFY